jgi:Uma2 family endonuclease
MSVLKKQAVVSVGDYLEAEKLSQVKHEYVAGEIYTMVGASRTHNVIAGNFYSALRERLKGGACRTFMTDLKVRIKDIFYYPDVLVTCSAADNDPYYSNEPMLVIEVLSPHTETADRTAKRLHYQSLPSLMEYVLASQDKMEVSVYRRAGADWDIESYSAGEIVRLDSVGLSIPMSDVYVEVFG